jgi:hypothetical protein
MSETKYLKQRGSGTIYIATPELLKQADLDPYEPEPVIPKKAKKEKPAPEEEAL